MQDRAAFTDVVGVDVANKVESLRVFYQDNNVIVLAFHDGFESLVELAQIVHFDRPVIIILTCSWYVSEERANIFKDILQKVIAVNNDRISYKTFLMVANSEIEAFHLRSTLSSVAVTHANNSSFIDERQFSPSASPKIYDAVLNSKVNKFKRHNLTAMVESKIFITYSNRDPSANAFSEIELKLLQPKKIYWSLKASEVPKILNQCHMGLMLSAEEGACYASLEYLLCGLPVVSTPSSGGRDEFYNERTALIVDPTPTAVWTGVCRCIDLLGAKRFDSQEIRDTTLAKVFESRSRLADAISERFVTFGIPPLQDDIVSSNIKMGSKFSTARNFWIKKILKFESRA